MKLSTSKKISAYYKPNTLYSAISFLGLCTLGLLMFNCKSKPKADSEQTLLQKSKPNVVYIMADDLGYGDLSCYGQTKFKTPNIDQLAEEGILFTQHYAGSTVCAPSRASLLTGLHTGHTQIRGNRPFKNGQMPMSEQTYTMANMFKDNGYTTGAFGKWGLGGSGSTGDPIYQGFDEFFGYLDQRLAHHYYPDCLWANDSLVTLEGNQGLNKGQYAPGLIHQKALQFIDDHSNEPFFLFYPTIIPHAELAAPQKYIDKYKGVFEDDKPYKGRDDGPRYKKGDYGSQTYPKATFAGMVNLLDDQVGELVQKVKDLGLEDNTIFIFTSDNGPHREGGAKPKFFDSNANLRGLKRDLFEGGIRVPFIVKWKGKVKPKTQTDMISASWDMFPTFSDILNTDLNQSTDGISILPTLVNNDTEQQQHDYLYWEFHEKNKKQAVRKGDWKLIVTNLENTPKYFLFNLAEDPEENHNLVDTQTNKVNELKALFNEARTPSKNFKYDFED